MSGLGVLLRKIPAFLWYNFFMKNKEKTFHQKKFDLWNIKKKEINKKEKEIQFREREIWWISIGVNIGFEQDGKN